MARNDSIIIENTRFIFKTNFSGDPTRDRFGSTVRKGNLIIPDPEQAADLAEMGINVKTTRPRDEEDEDFEPINYVSVIVNLESRNPGQVFLISGDAEPVLLDGESLAEVDHSYILNVNAILNPYHSERTGKTSLYVRRLYVEQDIEADPFASRYFKKD